MSDDNVTKFPGPSAKPAWEGTNDRIIATIVGVPAWEATSLLRWNGAVLEQMHRSTEGVIKWEPVPQAGEVLTPQDA